MNNSNDRFLLFFLKLCRGIGNISLLRLCSEMIENENSNYSMNDLIHIMRIKKQYIDSFKTSYKAIEKNLSKVENDFFQTKMVTILDDEYPDVLRHVYNPPVSLFYKGNIELIKKKSIAVIGSREPTYYATNVVKNLIKPLVSEEFVIVSGLASGVDTIVHNEVLHCAGTTIGVIGTGLDVCYPKNNELIQNQIATHHLLISEYPCGSKPLPHHFPQRNRIIAGISRGTCVIEAKKVSGTLITAQLALDSGKDVFAVPGNIYTKNSEGCHILIQQGAKCVWDPQHILDEYKN